MNIWIKATSFRLPALFLLIFLSCSTYAVGAEPILPLPGKVGFEKIRSEIYSAAIQLMENHDISYVYGGSKVGSEVECDSCGKCLSSNNPKPNLRLSTCPTCSHCSLDCSHFIQKVYQNVGISFSYLTTLSMRNLSERQLFNGYGWKVLSLLKDLGSLDIGDLLVYEGHVVMLMSRPVGGKASIIHATSGRELAGPGLGIQLMRNATLKGFRGPLHRILRHKNLIFGQNVRKMSVIK